uniref:Transmembrane protein n=1 Tax=Heterorhabditis bacteriophora TaxID=37862 RepID=A0A1I7W625_HETBA
MIKETLCYDVKRTMVNEFRKQLRFVCKSTKSGQLIRSANKENDGSFVLVCWILKYIFNTDRYKFNQRVKFLGISVAKYLLKVHVWAGISRRGATRIVMWDGKVSMTSPSSYFEVLGSTEFYLFSFNPVLIVTTSTVANLLL